MDITQMFLDLVANQFVHAVVVSILVAQVLKVVIYRLATGKFDNSLLWSASGMPSSHAAAVSSVTLLVGLTNGFSSALFGVCALFAMVVLYDATGVRQAVGQQAEILNYLMELRDRNDQYSHLLLERIGHTPTQVIMGCVLGAAVALVLYHA